ncbi:leucine--tRNA ligase [Salsipaludibacter albus]|uniref:leucine--tRNA ligase n=1 Tax=Salsipaludibacter albus TaxID=2849650 RepID=UPI001EE3E632|nr:leucine--tRNA ligase [Salsipaludibacter albus]MBY5162224.1 leucine--tRNA ligase [Salsipaludibacter albus]
MSPDAHADATTGPDASVARYDPLAIEPPIASRWVDEGTYELDCAGDDERFYALTMFPYPSGDLHMGHAEIFSIHDALVRHLRMTGHAVLNPIGWDAFGLPAENAARKRGENPDEWTRANIEEQAASIRRLGFSFDWSTRLHTCDPEYYRWTQWIFLELFHAGLVDRKEGLVNWCPGCETVLANEQVVDGRCERSDDLVQRRPLTQWYFRITDYAEELLDDLDTIDWPDRVKSMQRNWIGRSEGAEITFEVADDSDDEVVVYTTRPDTIFGATYFVFAPEHPLVLARMADDPGYADYLEEVSRRSDIERQATLGEDRRDKRGHRLDFDMVNPFTGETIPAFAADYVLMDYGTGAIMAVPVGDQRDFEFARANDLEVRVIIHPTDDEGNHLDPLDPDTMEEAWVGPGTMVGSGEYDGMPWQEAKAAIIDDVADKGWGRGTVNFRLRDWLISRQRSWGAPIPMVHCASCGPRPVPADQLPVELPDDLDWTVSGSPLAAHPTFAETTCPDCGGPARRDTDTMDTFVDSSWYFLRYLSPTDDTRAWPREKAGAWLPVDQYTGGVEHAILHLLYARFFVKALRDRGHVAADEPFQALLNQGQVILDGSRMSKSRGNLVRPGDVSEEYGADTLRGTILFASAPEDDIDWADVSPSGMNKWLARVWRLNLELGDAEVADGGADVDVAELRRAVHQRILAVSDDYDQFKYNTAIAKLMEITNATMDAERAGVAGGAVREALDAVLLMLAPICPFITEELWQRRHGASVHDQAWPRADESLLEVDTVDVIVQVNGKVRGKVAVASGADESVVEAAAMADDNAARFLAEGEVRKVIHVPDRLVNFVVA